MGSSTVRARCRRADVADYPPSPCCIDATRLPPPLSSCRAGQHPREMGIVSGARTPAHRRFHGALRVPERAEDAHRKRFFVIADEGRRRRGARTDPQGSIADALPPATRKAFADLVRRYGNVFQALGEERESLPDETTLSRSR